MSPGGVYVVLLFAVAAALGAAAYAWVWAVRASSMARCAVADADKARDQYFEARSTAAEDAEVIMPREPLHLVMPRRCARCGSSRDSLVTSRTGAGGRVLIFFCRDVEACIGRCRRSVL